MNIIEKIELRNIDPDDISDVLVKAERSFGLMLPASTFEKARTFGDICDVICSEIELEHLDDCTTQQAFYKIRRAIANSQAIEQGFITPVSEFKMLIPRKDRRIKLLRINAELGFSLKILKPKDWVSNALFAGLAISLIEMCFNWKLGLLSLAIAIIGFQLANRFGKEFQTKTVGEAATQAARENYIKSRRNPKTTNRHEIEKKSENSSAMILVLILRH